MKALSVIVAVFCGVFIAVGSAFAQIWTLHPGITGIAASSADGGRFIIAGAGFYASTNLGTTWMLLNSLVVHPSCLASSADGSKLVVGGHVPDTVYTSTNSGITWDQHNNSPHYGPFTQLRAMASSSDGSKLVAVLYGTCPTFTSVDSGVTWITNSTPVEYWTSVASSADGSKLAVAGYYNVYTSTNSGVTWVSNNVPVSDWGSVVSSTDGTKLMASSYGAGLYRSTDCGANWTSIGQSNLFGVIASSADCSKLVLWRYGEIFSSANSGQTWITDSVPFMVWTSVASSADGNKLVATTQSGGIYTSYSTPVPQLNLTSSTGNLTFSWLVPSTNFVLQQNFDLTPANWVTLTNTPVLNLTNLQDEVVLPPTNSSGFFRLISQ